MAAYQIVMLLFIILGVRMFTPIIRAEGLLSRGRGKAGIGERLRFQKKGPGD